MSDPNQAQSVVYVQLANQENYNLTQKAIEAKTEEEKQAIMAQFAKLEAATQSKKEEIKQVDDE